MAKNKYKLTKNQHFFPASSIKRFSDINGYIHIYRKSSRKIFKTKSNNKIFCGDHVWSHGVEAGWFKNIEDEFQEIADKIIEGKLFSLNTSQNKLALEFYALWIFRWFYAKHPVSDFNLSSNIKSLAFPVNQDSQEKLEKSGINSINDDLILPGRYQVGMYIRIAMSEFMSQYSDIKLSILFSENKEFIAPDVINTGIAIPLSPNFYLGFSPRGQFTVMQSSEVSQFNYELQVHSKDFFYGRSSNYLSNFIP